MVWKRVHRDCCYRPKEVKGENNNNEYRKGHSPITEFYTGRSIFVTGATGFLGKILIEKLLRCCPNIKYIYILLRTKKGQNAKQRLEPLMASKAFDRIRVTNSEALKKVVAISGDICHSELGISSTDLELLVRDVSVVFHSAATVKFNEPLRGAVEMNVLGTRKVVELCHKLPQLEALVHVSTAYANCDRTEVGEVIYPCSLSPQAMIDAMTWMDDELVDSITPKILGGRPNTYTFTKCLAENLLVEEAGALPVAIVRPSIVTAAWKEPYPGWIDNVNGPTGLLTAISKGVIRTVILDGRCDADFVPVDLAIGLLLSVAWHTATRKPNNLVVYNCTSGCVNTLSWSLVRDHSVPIIRKYPSTDLYRIPGGTTKTSRLYHDAVVLFNHYLPACFIDLASWILGKKPKMVRLYQRIHTAFETLEYFTVNQWKFHCRNVIDLFDELTPTDKELFNFDVGDIDWYDYFESYILGIRQFILKEDNSTIPVAKYNLRKIQVIHGVIKAAILLAGWTLLLCRFETLRHVFGFNYIVKFYYWLIYRGYKT